MVDTDVISRSSPLSRDGDRVSGWLQMQLGLTFVSAATLAELQFGASRLRLRGATRQAAALAVWVETVLTTYRGRTLEIDMEVGLRTGEMLARAEKAGFDPGFVDACIAATAEIHGFEVVTFNARDFAGFGVPHRRPDSGTTRS